LFTWQYLNGTADQVQARSRSAAGALGPIKTLSNSGQPATYPQVAVDDKDEGVVTLTWYDGTNYWVQGRTLSAAGVLGPIQTLSEAGQDSFGAQPAVSAEGDALVAWYRFDGSNSQVLGAATP